MVISNNLPLAQGSIDLMKDHWKFRELSNQNKPWKTFSDSLEGQENRYQKTLPLDVFYTYIGFVVSNIPEKDTGALKQICGIALDWRIGLCRKAHCHDNQLWEILGIWDQSILMYPVMPKSSERYSKQMK